MLKNHKNAKIRDTDVLLKVILYCAHCNNKLSVRTKVDKTKNGEKTRRYILCGTAEKKITNKKCYNRHIKNYEFEEKALAKISETLELYLNSNAFKNKEALKKILETQSNKGKKVNKKISTLYNDKLNGLLEEQDFKVFSAGLINERHRIEKIIEETQQELEEYNEDSTNKKIEDNMQEVIKQLLKSNQYTKEVINQLINKIEIDKDKHAVIYFNFYELNCLGGNVDVKQASNL